MKKTLLFVAIIVLNYNIQAQWLLGGNGAGTVNNNVNNFLGTSAPNNDAIHLGVRGNSDLWIDNLNGPPQLMPNAAGTQGGHWVGLGRIFGPALRPQAHLHIQGGQSGPQTTGLRPWFQTGVLTTEESDGMYVGLRNLGINSSYAVLNWSDDNFGGNGTDFMSFNFTSNVTGGLPNSVAGMELGRFNPEAGKGTLGIGNFMALGTYTDPVRRLEILDADPFNANHPTGGTGGGAPQLRLTYQYNANPALGIFSEFQSTNLGDLYINTHDFSKTAPYSDRFTGFHTVTPKNTVEINSQLVNSGSQDGLVPASWTGSTGASGLRFTDLNSSSTVVPLSPVVYDPTKVLTVDRNGDVILINDGGAPPTNNGITTLPVANGGPAIQLGVACNQLLVGTLLSQASLTTSRMVFLQNNSFWFANFLNQTGGVGFGGQPASTPFCNVGNTVEISSNMVNATYGNTNSSGLRLTHLTSASPVVTLNVNPAKVLSVDNNGDVVLVTPAGGGIGTCAVPTVLTPAHGAIDMNGNNFIFKGTGTGNGANGVGIGIATCVPAAKLDVLQNASGTSTATWGINVENKDASSSTLPAIGIKSLASSTVPWPTQTFKVAGWFESTPVPNPFNPLKISQYAIFVPGSATSIVGSPGNPVSPFAGALGGTVDIGYPYATALPDYLLDVNGDARNQGTWIPSDSILKSNITPFTSGLAVIRQLSPKFYNYNGKGGFNTARQHVGVLAQNLVTIAPYAVDTVFTKLDSTDANLSPVMNIYTEALLYTSINAVKQLDNIVSQQRLTTDSLRNDTIVAGNGLSKDSTKQIVLGNDIGSTAGQLTSDREISQNFHDVYFSGLNKNVSSDRVIIGLNQGSTISANSKLFVSQKASDPVTNNSAAIEAFNTGTSSGDVVNLIGVKATVAGTNNSKGANLGGYFYADKAIAVNCGVAGITGKSTSLSTTIGNYIGGAFAATGDKNNIGIYSTATGGKGNYAGYFNGDVFVNGGSNSGTGYLVASDAMFKTNINAITNASDILKQLQPKTFYFDTTNAYKLKFSNKKQYGLIAQDVQTILPELVGASTKPAEYDSLGNVAVAAVTYKNLNYDAFIALLIKSDQEKQVRLDHQDSLINQLASQINSCCSTTVRTTQNGGGKNSTAIDVELNNADVVVLNQNTPNPFAEQTSITYNIPQNTSAAQILFYDINGRQIKAVDVTKKGAGQLNVYANDLTNGVYSYTLIVDGKIIDTKKMVKQQ